MSDAPPHSVSIPPPIELEPGATFAGKYRVIRILGLGGAGTVFAATHLGTGRLVAVKVLHHDLAHIPEAAGRLRREAQLTGLIRHPNIVDIYDVGVEEGTLYLVMEYLRGQPLGTFLGNGPMQVGAVIRTVTHAMRGVAAAHAAGIVHRDLKPDNIFVGCGDPDDPSRFKVLDFGVSKLTSHEPGSADVGLTVTGAMVGTPYYMAPEQVRDSRTVDHRADIYALGVVLFEALSGKRPFTAETLGTLLLEIMQEGLPSLAAHRPDLPPAVVQAVDKAVAPDPAARFQDVESMLDALLPFAEGPGLIGWDAHASLPPPPASLRAQSHVELRQPFDSRPAFDSRQPFDSRVSLPDAAFAAPSWKRSDLRPALVLLALLGGALVWWAASAWDDPAATRLTEPSRAAMSPAPGGSATDRPATEPEVRPAAESAERTTRQPTDAAPSSAEQDEKRKRTKKKRKARQRAGAAPRATAAARATPSARPAPRTAIGRSGVEVSSDEF